MHQDLRARAMLTRWLWAAVSVLFGAGTALAEFGFLLLTPLIALPGPQREPLSRLAVRLTEVELRRITRFHGPLYVDALSPQRCRRYLALRWLVGGLGFGVLLMLVLCVTTAGSMLSAWALGGDWGLIENSNQRVDTSLLALTVAPGTMLIFVSIVGVSGVSTLDHWLATQALGSGDLMHRRILELTSTRAEVIEAINDERRRIERDLHDGVQQRLVALGMLVGRARRATGGAVLEQAQSMVQEAIGELREVALRIYPSALDSSGLQAVLESLAQRSSVPVRLSFGLASRLPSALETVIYFVVSEALTNAAKHADPTLIEVTVTPGEDRIRVVITDDGPGGADPTGTGLSGLASRVAAVDGRFLVHSPPGGPTSLEASLPCA
ncbi:sensor histidine kinase [Amycolatopsis taiwanensis]|uniref:histidine kinase n=1 Tax=Amycolatopsis taiwanensis TaxID=342230 RepID=A0A9W6R5K0_9PSEU|nr:histidine kinase [Amycolatopsis taiwanensis]GLY69851.1 ATPase [Amycolatopsis taiwanensis]